MLSVVTLKNVGPESLEEQPRCAGDFVPPVFGTAIRYYVGSVCYSESSCLYF